MRDAFHEELDSISGSLVEMTRLVGSAMARATTALLDADLTLAESVIAADDQVDQLQHALDDTSFDLLARQQPVAGDLRTIITSLRMSADLERMGDLARHVAKVARRRYPQSAIPPELRGTIVEMGSIAEELVAKVGSIIAARDVEAALALEAEDDEMDRLHRSLFKSLMDDKWKHGTETAVDVTLCGRYYERFADHAVSVAKRMVFLVTGEHPDPTT
ncbi:phosphate signaling complex protein PhoU [Catenulispora yoronensis]|uniref:Phosphate-specific transport system accessory protein PhoU n=1 Tax=Catenulispora yoronensis TaxID=450799 RepID=A0ABN2TL91_9ACTN